MDAVATADEGNKIASVGSEKTERIVLSFPRPASPAHRGGLPFGVPRFARIKFSMRFSACG
jgi:hypothetical protein